MKRFLLLAAVLLITGVVPKIANGQAATCTDGASFCGNTISYNMSADCSMSGGDVAGGNRVLGGQVCGFGSAQDSGGYYMIGTSEPSGSTAAIPYGTSMPGGWSYNKSGDFNKTTLPNGEFAEDGYNMRFFGGTVTMIPFGGVDDETEVRVGSNTAGWKKDCTCGTTYTSVKGSCQGTSSYGPREVQGNPGDPISFKVINTCRPNNGSGTWGIGGGAVYFPVTQCYSSSHPSNTTGKNYHPVSPGVCQPEETASCTITSFNATQKGATGVELRFNVSSAGGTPSWQILENGSVLRSGNDFSNPVDLETSSGAHTYRLNCLVNSQEKDHREASVYINAAPTCSFEESSISAETPAHFRVYGGDGIYSWSTQDANPSSGNVNGDGSRVELVYLSQGTKTVSVTSAGMNGSCTIPVNPIVSCPTVGSFSVNPTNIQQGQSSNMAWRVNNLTEENKGYCDATGWTWDKSGYGSKSTGALYSTTRFTLSCNKPGCAPSEGNPQIVTVGPPPAETLTANPNPIPNICANNGQTTITSQSGSAFDIRVSSPGGSVANSSIFASHQAGGPYNDTTGNWVGNGTTFYMVDQGTFTVRKILPVSTSGNCGTASANLTITNTTAASRNPGFKVNDGWRLSLTTSPAQANKSVEICATKNGSSLGCTPMDATDGSGSWSRTGMFDSSVVGTWDEWAKIGGTLLSTHVNFTVSTNPPPPPPPPPGGSTIGCVLNATPFSGSAPLSTTLSWQTSGSPTTCQASGDWSGYKSAYVGYENFSGLYSSKTYNLTCTNGVSSGSCSKTVTVSQPQPPTCSISASPSSANSSTAPVLTWSSNNAANCTATGGWSGNKSTAGTQTQSTISNTTTYGLTCSNSSGQTGSCSATVTIGTATPTLACTVTSANPLAVNQSASFAASGGTGSYAWTASGGSPTSGTGPSFSTRYSSNGVKSVVLSDGASSKTCTVTVGPSTPTTGLEASFDPDRTNGLWYESISHSAPVSVFPRITYPSVGIVVGALWCDLNNTSTDVSNPSPQMVFNSYYTGTPMTPYSPCAYSSPGTYYMKWVGWMGNNENVRYQDIVPITVNPGGTAVSCSGPSTGYTGDDLNFSSSGSGSTFAWTATGGTPASGSGSSFTTRFSAIGTKSVKVTSSGASSTCSVNISDRPTLSVALTATSSSPNVPSNVQLTANVSGNATGTINYSFWWNCNSTTTNVSAATAACGDPSVAANGAKFDNSNENPKIASHIYTTAGTFHPKVIVERGAAASAENRLTFTAEPEVTVPPTCSSFTSSPSQLVIPPPTSATLSWSCRNADSCAITPGVGSVNKNGGSASVSPTSTTQYTLTCSNATGTVTKTTNIRVINLDYHEGNPR